jgi:deoxyinosine 3'endonuclease (endonuclease V)
LSGRKDDHQRASAKGIRTAAGVDVSYVGDMGIGAVTVLDYGMLELVETQVATCYAQRYLGRQSKYHKMH